MWAVRRLRFLSALMWNRFGQNRDRSASRRCSNAGRPGSMTGLIAWSLSGSAWESNPPATRLTRRPTVLKTAAATRRASTSRSKKTETWFSPLDSSWLRSYDHSQLYFTGTGARPKPVLRAVVAPTRLGPTNSNGYGTSLDARADYNTVSEHRCTPPVPRRLRWRAPRCSR